MPNVTLGKKGLILPYSSKQYSQRWRGTHLYRWGRHSDRTRNLADHISIHTQEAERERRGINLHLYWQTPSNMVVPHKGSVTSPNTAITWRQRYSTTWAIGGHFSFRLQWMFSQNNGWYSRKEDFKTIVGIKNEYSWDEGPEEQMSAGDA